MSGDAAMRFGLNLPKYSSLGHRGAMIAIAERAYELGYASLWTSDHILLPTSLPDPCFEISMRTMTRVVGGIEDIDPETVLQGDPAAIVQQVERYAAAGVQHLVIEPVSSDLDDFLDQITRFALDVVAPTGRQPTHATELAS